MSTATANEPQTAVGVFDDLEHAQNTLDTLRRAGFPEDEIGIIGHVGDNQQPVSIPSHLQTPEENVVRGVTMGGIMGALLGALVILIGKLISQASGLGFWFEVVSGAALGAAVGGVFLALASLPLSRKKARFYHRELEKGRFIVTVTNPQRRDEAMSLLRR